MKTVDDGMREKKLHTAFHRFRVKPKQTKQTERTASSKILSFFSVYSTWIFK